MKLLAVSYGTEGDTRPIAALCQSLNDSGHEVHLLADQSMLAKAQASGVPCSPLAGNIMDALGAGNSGADLVHKARNVSTTARALAEIASKHTDAWLQTILAAGAGCDALLVSGLAAFVGLSAGEYLRIPVIGTGLIPITPTNEFASPFLRPRSYPRWLNRLSYTIVNNLLWLYFRSATNAARIKTGKLQARRSLWTGHPMLYGVSSQIVPTPKDWPNNAFVCGSWALEPNGWVPPKDLADFINAGESPIYVGFGSMSLFANKEIIDSLVEAIGSRRTLIYSDGNAIGTRVLPSNFHKIGPTPHSWLFPRVALAIHHGGSGTSHSAAQAGLPSVILPFAADQFFWAKRLEIAGIAPPCAPALNVDAEKLKKMLDFASNDHVRARAKAIGYSMTNEDGKKRAVALIESIMHK